MTFQRIRNIEDLIKNQISFILEFLLFYLNLGKNACFQNCILGPRKCSSCSKYLFRRWKFILAFLDFFIYFSRIYFRRNIFFGKVILFPLSYFYN